MFKLKRNIEFSTDGEKSDCLRRNQFKTERNTHSFLHLKIPVVIGTIFQSNTVTDDSQKLFILFRGENLICGRITELLFNVVSLL